MYSDIDKHVSLLTLVLENNVLYYHFFASNAINNVNK